MTPDTVQAGLKAAALFGEGTLGRAVHSTGERMKERSPGTEDSALATPPPAAQTTSASWSEQLSAAPTPAAVSELFKSMWDGFHQFLAASVSTVEAIQRQQKAELDAVRETLTLGLPDRTRTMLSSEQLEMYVQKTATDIRDYRRNLIGALKSTMNGLETAQGELTTKQADFNSAIASQYAPELLSRWSWIKAHISSGHVLKAFSYSAYQLAMETASSEVARTSNELKKAEVTHAEADRAQSLAVATVTTFDKDIAEGRLPRELREKFLSKLEGTAFKAKDAAFNEQETVERVFNNESVPADKVGVDLSLKTLVQWTRSFYAHYKPRGIVENLEISRKSIKATRINSDGSESTLEFSPYKPEKCRVWIDGVYQGKGYNDDLTKIMRWFMRGEESFYNHIRDNSVRVITRKPT